MTPVLVALAIVSVASAIVAAVGYFRSRSAVASLNAAAESVYAAAVDFEVATTRTVLAMREALIEVDDMPQEARADFTLVGEILVFGDRIDTEFSRKQIPFGWWDPAQARRAVEEVHVAGLISDDDVDYLGRSLRSPVRPSKRRGSLALSH